MANLRSSAGSQQAAHPTPPPARMHCTHARYTMHSQPRCGCGSWRILEIAQEGLGALRKGRCQHTLASVAEGCVSLTCTQGKPSAGIGAMVTRGGSAGLQSPQCTLRSASPLGGALGGARLRRRLLEHPLEVVGRAAHGGGEEVRQLRPEGGSARWGEG